MYTMENNMNRIYSPSIRFATQGDRLRDWRDNGLNMIFRIYRIGRIVAGDSPPSAEVASVAS